MIIVEFYSYSACLISDGKASVFLQDSESDNFQDECRAYAVAQDISDDTAASYLAELYYGCMLAEGGTIL